MKLKKKLKINQLKKNKGQNLERKKIRYCS